MNDLCSIKPLAIRVWVFVAGVFTRPGRETARIIVGDVAAFSCPLSRRRPPTMFAKNERVKFTASFLATVTIKTGSAESD